MSGAEESARAASDDDATDSVFLPEATHDADGDGCGLALDDAQAEEIRRVFLITLPQYLEPVEQMIEQLFATEEVDEETRRALDTTLSSIGEAASRIGVDEVYQHVATIREELMRLDEEPHEHRSELRDGISREVEEVKRIASGTGEPSVERLDGPGSQTIFKALEGLEDIDRSVLQQLTAAGLVTVDQLRMARPDEIVAVTGLDIAVVQKILASLLDAEGPSGRGTGAAAGPGARSALGKRAEGGEALRTADHGPLDAGLAAKLRMQVESEAALNEVRVQVQRLRARIAAQREEVAAAEQSRDDQRATLDRLRDRLADRLTALGEARTGRDELDSALIETEEAVRRAEERLARLRKQRQTLLDDEARSAQEVADLVQEVERLLDSSPKPLQREATDGRPWRR